MAPKKKGRKPVGMAAMQDKNESIKNCVVCLDVVTVMGKIPVCDHQFCYTCIYEWSKTTNTCPLCKKRFRCITKISESSPPRMVRISDKDQTEHYHEGDDFNPLNFSFSDDSENDEPNDSLADFIVNDTTFYSSDEENESVISSITSPPTIRSRWQQRLNTRITSTVNSRPRRNQIRDLSSIQVLFSPPVTRNRSRGTQLLMDVSSPSPPLPSSRREQGSISPYSPIVTRGRFRNNNRVISSNERSPSVRDSSPNIAESESDVAVPLSDSNISIISSSLDSVSSNQSCIDAGTTLNSISQESTDSNLSLHDPSPSLSRSATIQPRVSLRPVINRIKTRGFDNKSIELSSGAVSQVFDGASTPFSPYHSSLSVNVIEDSPVETEEEREEEVESDEDTTQPLSNPSPSLSLSVKDHTNKRRSICGSVLPLCPLAASNSMSLSPINSQLQPVLKRRAKYRIIKDSTSEDEAIIEEIPSRRKRRKQIKYSPSKWLSSRKHRGVSGDVRMRKRYHGNRRAAVDSGSDYNPFDF